MATLTLGTPGAASVKTINFDALFSQSLANNKKGIEDTISTSNSFYKRIKDSAAWESYEGGTHLEIPLMTELGSTDTYAGYDLLNTDPMDGVTKALFTWARTSTPITISGDEETDNYGPQQLINMVTTKTTQAVSGAAEFFSKMLLQGNLLNSGTITDPYTSPNNGSVGINPLALLIHYDPTSTVTIGNIDQGSNTWWRNKSVTFAGTTTTTELLKKVMNLVNECSKGPGGRPDLVLCDQTTYEWLITAIYHRTRHDPKEVADWPFESFMFRNIMFTWDEFVSDPVTGVANTDTLGVIYCINTKFFSVKYHPRRNFIHRPFQTPPNQDGKVSHIFWKGQVCVSNRRKHGVGHSVPRTFTIS